MKTTVWGLLSLLAIPGCLLVQPLDDPKPADGAAGGGNKAGGSGQPSGGSGNSGSGNKAGSGSVPPGGAPSGGAPSSVDFTLFTGTWTVTSGQSTVTCGDEAPQTTTATPGGTDTFGLGTVSDLVLNPDTDCEIWADVDDRTASLNPATPNCATSDADYDYDLYIESFDFTVSADGKTAEASMTTSTLVSDSSGVVGVCDSEHAWKYKR